MAFSDQDLENLKRRMKSCNYSIGTLTVKALLERLEAAEVLVDACRIYHGDALKFKPELYEARLRSAGK